MRIPTGNFLQKYVAWQVCWGQYALTQQLLTFAKGGEPVRTTVRLSDLVKEAAEFALHGSKVRCEFAIASGLGKSGELASAL